MLLFIGQLCPTLCYPMDCNTKASMALTVYWSLFELMSAESEIPSNYFILCHPLLILPSIFYSIRVFSSESALHIRWRKFWSFIHPQYQSLPFSRLISFRIDWFDILPVQGTLKSLLQHHNSRASILLCLALFMV